MSRFAGKLFAGLFLVALALSMLADAGAAGERNHPPFYYSNERTYIVVDPDAGCHYLRQGYQSMTPRIASDGKTHMGCRGVKP